MADLDCAALVALALDDHCCVPALLERLAGASAFQPQVSTSASLSLIVLVMAARFKEAR
jgi:hypothetical protein